jgi:hypothetical protein
VQQPYYAKSKQTVIGNERDFFFFFFFFQIMEEEHFRENLQKTFNDSYLWFFPSTSDRHNFKEVEFLSEKKGEQKEKRYTKQVYFIRV